jgi:hypothetical protein
VSERPKKFFAFSLWKYRYVFRIRYGPFRSWTLEIERGLKRWY